MEKCMDRLTDPEHRDRLRRIKAKLTDAKDAHIDRATGRELRYDLNALPTAASPETLLIKIERKILFLAM